jgi:ABC-type iron transport system FetAB ATPase subunit
LTFFSGKAARKASLAIMANANGTKQTGERRSLCSTMSNDQEGPHRSQSSQDEQHPITQVWNKHTDAIPPDSCQFDRHEWAKRNIRILDSMAGEARQRGVLFEDISIQASGSPLQIQPTVLSALIRPVASVVNLLFHKETHQHRTKILHKFDGLVRSGELLLVLGRPGSGCSTFLKAICGYLDGLHLDPASKIQYRGVSFARMMNEYRGEVVYNQEEDHHFPHLTVGETLEFAAYARAPHIRLGNLSREEYAKIVVQVVMALFELSHAHNTQVGNEYVRGVSGGERKRVR